MDEKRRSPRRRILKTGSIVFNGGRSVMTCTLRNISDHGALLKLAHSLSIPEQFVLCFDGMSVHCEVARRELTELGVAFQVGSEMEWPRIARYSTPTPP